MLKPLDQHNRERSEGYRRMRSNVPRPNGLACPKCGDELVDSDPNSTLASNPPQKSVACLACGYAGYRVA